MTTMSATDRAYAVRLPYATFALVVRDGVVVRAAPIARWAVGRPEDEALEYYRRKGGSVARLDGGDD